jgi:hypothetical protein
MIPTLFQPAILEQVWPERAHGVNMRPSHSEYAAVLLRIILRRPKTKAH